MRAGISPPDSESKSCGRADENLLVAPIATVGAAITGGQKAVGDGGGGGGGGGGGSSGGSGGSGSSGSEGIMAVVVVAMVFMVMKVVVVMISGTCVS